MCYNVCDNDKITEECHRFDKRPVYVVSIGSIRQLLTKTTLTFARIDCTTKRVTELLGLTSIKNRS